MVKNLKSENPTSTLLNSTTLILLMVSLFGFVGTLMIVNNTTTISPYAVKEDKSIITDVAVTYSTYECPTTQKYVEIGKVHYLEGCYKGRCSYKSLRKICVQKRDYVSGMEFVTDVSVINKNTKCTGIESQFNELPNNQRLCVVKSKTPQKSTEFLKEFKISQDPMDQSGKCESGFTEAQSFFEIFTSNHGTTVQKVCYKKSIIPELTSSTTPIPTTTNTPQITQTPIPAPTQSIGISLVSSIPEKPEWYKMRISKIDDYNKEIKNLKITIMQLIRIASLLKGRTQYSTNNVELGSIELNNDQITELNSKKEIIVEIFIKRTTRLPGVTNSQEPKASIYFCPVRDVFRPDCLIEQNILNVRLSQT